MATLPHVAQVYDQRDVGLAQFDPFLGSCWSSTSILRAPRPYNAKLSYNSF